MSLFAKAVGAVAGAGANVMNKYVDERLAQQRAQFMAELQRTTATNIRNDDWKFKTDPTNVEALRGIKAGDIEAEGKARRGQKVADLTDPDLVTAESTKAERDAADARRRKVADYEAETPLVVDRTRQTAEATAKAQAKWRDAKDPRQTVAGKIKELEAAIGRTLTQPEKEALAGLGGKGANDPTKQALDAVLDRYKADGSTLPADQVGQEVTKILRSLQVGPMEAQLKAGIERARADGKVPEAIAELRSKGLNDQQLAALFTPEELKASMPAKPGGLMQLGKNRAQSGGDGEGIQLLTPFYKLNEARKRMQEESEGF